MDKIVYEGQVGRCGQVLQEGHGRQCAVGRECWTTWANL